jgi:hypothetical protein
MENLPGMLLMLHKRESKSKGENHLLPTPSARSKQKEGQIPAFLFSA